jgi:hypothetical protein
VTRRKGLIWLTLVGLASLVLVLTVIAPPLYSSGLMGESILSPIRSDFVDDVEAWLPVPDGHGDFHGRPRE